MGKICLVITSFHFLKEKCVGNDFIDLLLSPDLDYASTSREMLARFSKEIKELINYHQSCIPTLWVGDWPGWGPLAGPAASPPVWPWR